jgi:uncharacterized membrane protein YkvA (DUF1232 family)
MDEQPRLPIPATLVKALFGVLYIVVPFDLLPESFLPIVGLIDDLLVGLITIVYPIAHSFLADEETPGSRTAIVLVLIAAMTAACMFVTYRLFN